MPPPSRALPRTPSTTSQLPDSGYTSTCSLLASDAGCPSLLRTAGSSTLLGARNCNTGGVLGLYGRDLRALGLQAPSRPS